LRETLEIDNIILLLQENRLQWYGHVMRKEDNDWVKKCMEYEVEDPDQEVDQRGLAPLIRPQITKEETSNNKSSTKSFGKSASPPLAADNAFIRFVCY